MLIAITKNALSDPDEKFSFRKNSLISLKKICESGHTLLIEDAEIVEEQALLLDQEHISYEKEGEADLVISGSEQQLQLLKEENELLSSENWEAVVRFITREARKASLERKTNETDISININLDGTGKADISTGLNFFDHMLDQIARHGLIDLKLTCKGDLEVDEHHTIEDVAIALGEVITKALGNKKGIERYGFVLPMDEAQATVAVDLSGRPFLVFEGDFKREYVGDMPTEMIKHFFYSLAMNLKATIHVSFSGENDHHKIEACFKGLARALKMAIEQNGRIKNLIPSSKGTL
ncbi:imidazoleglycerol-phosphate dehydratase HisB [Gracilimonas sediminicola]|uniref:Imidazoleglycerol-phosphate dehydratase n=1 Tax=Gracilimonas sediminicola TaxID=2952158 RepID=A0A9X2L1S5_9BACT|nr:imidazoleglycerol-phosphate dehydratase HisB [Gracilimonas sediminicola]MCP9290736.1 imidazoleglycerol-phosphate dehydratase HisB [Gracilimonas sediminicola]